VFSVGALRRDGIVIPFATYDKNHWRRIGRCRSSI
jgi:hypothetical protein